MRRDFDPSVYFVLDPAYCKGRDVVEIARAALRGGVTMIQYRDKSGDRSKILHNAKKLKEMMLGSGVPLLVNDHVDIAGEIGADGVHLGQEDMTPSEARKILGPDVIIGQTAFREKHFTSLGKGTSVDYLGTGPFYETTTDKGKEILGQRKFTELVSFAQRRPVVAIGGITPVNMNPVFIAGADGVAVMSYICGADNPETAARAVIKSVKGARYTAITAPYEESACAPAR